MPPRMTIRSAGLTTSTLRGGRTGGRTGREGGRTRGRFGDLGNGEIDGQGGQNLLPTILAQVGEQGRNQGNGRNQNSDTINDNIRGDIRDVIANNDRRGFTYKEFLACNLKEYDGNGCSIVYTRWIEKMKSVQNMSGCEVNQKVKYNAGLFVGKALMWCYSQIYTRGREADVAGTLADEALRNGSIKKNLEKKGNGGESSKDRNVRDDNKRTRTGNAFATTTNPIKRENTGTVPKCTTYKTYHPPEAPCRTCFNCNCPGHYAKDCRVVPKNVNPVNARNLTAARGACYECGSTDLYKSACLMLNQAQGPGGNSPNQAFANNGGQGRGNQGNQSRGKAFMLGAEEAR
ncbi:reverse transcriptase domain-containing protein [Tanacetum coccineum]